MPVLPALAAALLLAARPAPPRHAASPREPAVDRLSRLEADLARDRKDPRGLAALAGI